MGPEIIALRCPSCANPTNVVARQLRFGYEFTCRHCATVSVVIINRQLYIPTPGEQVCLACGRVAPRGSRFCQCGRPLVRTCVACAQEFPIGHKICDRCGWPQDGGKPKSPSLDQGNDAVFFSRIGGEIRINPAFITRSGTRYVTAHITEMRAFSEQPTIEDKKWFGVQYVPGEIRWRVVVFFGTGAGAPMLDYYASSERDAKAFEAAVANALKKSTRRTPPPHYPETDEEGNEIDEFGDRID